MKDKNNRKYFIQAGILTKALSILLILSMLLSIAPVVLGGENNTTELKIEKEFTFLPPQFIQNNENSNYVDMVVEGAPIRNSEPGAPALPAYGGVEYLPFGSQVTEVTCTYRLGVQTAELPVGMKPTPQPVPLPLLPPGSPFDVPFVPSERSDIYNADVPYGQRFTYTVDVGRNTANELATVVYYKITPCVFESVKNGVVSYITNAVVEITYTLGNPLSSRALKEHYELLILTPRAYVRDLQPLVVHKEKMGFKTKLVTLDEIYAGEYFEPSTIYNRDDAEKIKYFIYQAILEWNVSYVMAVGGFRTFWGLDIPSKQFPVRFAHYDDGAEPGYVSDQYYSCCIKAPPALLFDSWDSNGNGIFGENADSYGHSPDVAFGRLPCRNRMEVRTMVDKIIYYETKTYGEEWFKRMLTITGDGFGDLDDLGIPWNVSSLDAGEYTIYAQSALQSDPSVKGPIDQVTVTVDFSSKSRVNFSEEDHLKIEPLDPEQETIYPGKPVAEIVVPGIDGYILGNTDVDYEPPQAYCSDYTGWGHVRYVNKVLYIKTKSYDPSPKDDITPPENFGSYTTITVWVNDSEGNMLPGFPVTKSSTTFYEGEMECQQGLDFMPDTFEKVKLWASNGQWYSMTDVINEFSTGYGFVYFAGHGNPMSWGDHLPGIPGGRKNGMINGMKCINLEGGPGWDRYYAEEGDPFFPMDQLTNGYKQPIIVVGGCHNSMFDASFTRLLADPNKVLFTVLHGAWVPECFNEWIIRMPQGGGIASFGCSGLGYGYLGAYNIEGLTGWINGHLFEVIAGGVDILGDAFRQTLSDYVVHQDHRKTFEEWTFLGDPTLKIGGYPPETGSLDDTYRVTIGDIVPLPGGRVHTNITNNGVVNLTWFDWEIRIEGFSPLGKYFGLSQYPILYNIFRGRVLSGGYTTEHVPCLKPGKTLEIESTPTFGIGHVKVNVSVYLGDELIAWKIDPATLEDEDGFLLGSRLLLYHPEE